MAKETAPDYTENLSSNMESNSSLLREGNGEDGANDSLLNKFEFTPSLEYDAKYEVDALGTSTGGIYRTNRSPTRVEINNIDNAIYIYQDGVIVMQLTGFSITFFTVAGLGAGSIYGFGTDTLVMNVDGGDTYTFDGGAIWPETTGVYDLGRSNKRWGTLYVDNVDIGTSSQDFLQVNGTVIVPGAGFTLTPLSGYVLLSPAGAVTSSVTTAINNGATVGQMLILQGNSDANTATITDGANTALAGNCVLGASDTLSLIWDGLDWVETARSNN